MKNPIIAAELKRLAAEHDGVLQPETVVAAASDPDSPLHAQFEWDDTKAAAEHRLWQARTLIRRVIVEYEKAPGERAEHQLFVSITTDRAKEGGGYRVLTDVLSDEDLRQQLLIDARREMATFRSKFAKLTELAQVFDSMAEAEKKIDQRVAAAV